jgi:multiple sugar transport system permease protein
MAHVALPAKGPQGAARSSGRHPVPAAPVRSRRVQLARRATARVLWFVILLAFTAFFVVPVIWLLLAPTKTDHQLVFKNPFSPGSYHNLAHAWSLVFNFQDHALLSWLENSAIYSGGGVVLALVCAVPAGYGLALTEFIGRKLLLGITLVVMIIPATALVLPLFLEINALHLIDTPFSVILPFAFFPFGVYICYIFFSSTIPKDLLAAARVDGCSEVGVFRRVALPLARPIVALVAFFAFVADWNNFFLPFVMFPDSTKFPLQVGLQYLLSSTPSFNPSIGGTDVPILRPELALATVVAIAPVLIVFLFAQRALVTGMLAGATKE